MIDNCYPWDNMNTVASRIADGVVAITKAFVTGNPMNPRPSLSGGGSNGGNNGGQVNWNGNNWALGCDFKGNDLTSVQIPGEKCGEQCSVTPQCTHFTHTKYNGGTCWMKKGPVSPSDAIFTNDNTMVCGFMR
jgi:hypothetical protein